MAYFGILQDRGELWQYAPYREHAPQHVSAINSSSSSSEQANPQDSGRGRSTVEYSVDDTDAAQAVIEIDRIDFSKLHVIFSDMVFRTSYLALFINRVSADKVS